LRVRGSLTRARLPDPSFACYATCASWFLSPTRKGRQRLSDALVSTSPRNSACGVAAKEANISIDFLLQVSYFRCLISVSARTQKYFAVANERAGRRASVVSTSEVARAPARSCLGKPRRPRARALGPQDLDPIVGLAAARGIAIESFGWAPVRSAGPRAPHLLTRRGSPPLGRTAFRPLSCAR